MRRLGLAVAIVVAVVDILYLSYIRFKQGGRSGRDATGIRTST
jgi:hypothetical protein